MKKFVLLSIVSLIAFRPQLYSISLADYIRQKGMPQFYDWGLQTGITLNLSNKNLTDLEGFENIPNLSQIRSLYLDNNQIKTLPNTIFTCLHNLENLYLNSNQLQTLPEYIFNGLINLKILVLYRNQLQELPENIFNGLINLHDLRLNENKLQTLPPTIFNGLHNLRELSLSSNQLKALPETIFAHLRNLIYLFLYNNQLTTLPAGIFKDLQNLQYLYLYSNHLQTLPDNIFNGLRNLTVLQLYSNPFSGECVLILPALIAHIPRLNSLDCKPIDKALKSYRVYNPKALKDIVIQYIMQNLTHAQLEQLAETNPTAFSLFPLDPDAKKALLGHVIAQQIAQLLSEKSSKCTLL